MIFIVCDASLNIQRLLSSHRTIFLPPPQWSPHSTVIVPFLVPDDIFTVDIALYKKIRKNILVTYWVQHEILYCRTYFPTEKHVTLLLITHSRDIMILFKFFHCSYHYYLSQADSKGNRAYCLPPIFSICWSLHLDFSDFSV